MQGQLAIINSTLTGNRAIAGADTVAVHATALGRSVRGKCIAQTTRNQRKPRCNRNVMAGTLRLTAHAATNRIRFQGRLTRSHTLAPGRYSAAITATDASRWAAAVRAPLPHGRPFQPGIASRRQAHLTSTHLLSV
jgi:hypothetical protein